jgi:hypothetical protein
MGGGVGGGERERTCLGGFCVELTSILLLGERFGVWLEVSGVGGWGGGWGRKLRKSYEAKGCVCRRGQRG